MIYLMCVGLHFVYYKSRFCSISINIIRISFDWGNYHLKNGSKRTDGKMIRRQNDPAAKFWRRNDTHSWKEHINFFKMSSSCKTLSLTPLNTLEKVWGHPAPKLDFHNILPLRRKMFQYSFKKVSGQVTVLYYCKYSTKRAWKSGLHVCL